MASVKELDQNSEKRIREQFFPPSYRILTGNFIRCKKCKGVRVVKEKKPHEIFIEKGTPDRHRIILHGQGDEEVTLSPLIEALKLIHSLARCPSRRCYFCFENTASRVLRAFRK